MQAFADPVVAGLIEKAVRACNIQVKFIARITNSNMVAMASAELKSRVYRVVCQSNNNTLNGT